MDSKLVVEQMAGRWKVKHAGLLALVEEARALAPAGTTWTWVPRVQNAHADRLANEALDGTRDGVIGVPVPSGKIIDRDGAEIRTVLRELVGDGTVTEIRVTPRQDLLLCGIAPSRIPEVEQRLRDHGDPMAGIDDAVGSLEPLLDMWERDLEAGLGELNYPPDYPKMPGEPPRVQPSKKVASHWDEHGNRIETS